MKDMLNKVEQADWVKEFARVLVGGMCVVVVAMGYMLAHIIYATIGWWTVGIPFGVFVMWLIGRMFIK